MKKVMDSFEENWANLEPNYYLKEDSLQHYSCNLFFKNKILFL